MSAADALQVWGHITNIRWLQQRLLAPVARRRGAGSGLLEIGHNPVVVHFGQWANHGGLPVVSVGWWAIGAVGPWHGCRSVVGARLWPVEAVGAATDVRRQSTIGPVSGQSQPPLLAQSPGHPPPQKPCQASPTPKLPSRWQTRDGTGVEPASSKETPTKGRRRDLTTRQRHRFRGYYIPGPGCCA